MGQMKNKKLMTILIISISAVVILIAGILAFIFIGLSSPKKQFFKYLAQISDSENGLWDSRIDQYNEKKESVPYKNTMKFSTNFDVGDEDANEKINSFSITSEGQVDNPNGNANQDISLNYSESEKIPITYRKIGDVIGLEIEELGNKFITIDTTNPDTLTSSISSVVSSFNELDESVDQLKNDTDNSIDNEKLLNRYLKTIVDSIQNKSFEEVKNENIKGYTLSITADDIKNIIVNVLETLKNDSETLNMLNSELVKLNREEITTSEIDEMIENINTNWNDASATSAKAQLENALQNLKITIYTENKKITSIEIKSDQLEFTIEKNYGADEYGLNGSINLDISGTTAQIAINTNYTGLQNMDNLTENYDVNIQLGDYAFNYNIANEVAFQDSVSIDKFTEQNSYLLNNYQQENQEVFLSAFMEAIGQKLKIDETDGPLNMLNPLPYLLGGDEYIQSLASSVDASTLAYIKETLSSILDEASSASVDEIYNNNILSSEEKDQKYMEILNQRLIENATFLHDYNLTLDYNGAEISESNKITEFPATLEINKVLELVIESNGKYVFNDKASSTKRNTNINEEEIANFNAEYEMYASPNLKGVTAKGLLSIIDSNNESNRYQFKIEEINFNGEEFEATQQNIASIKEELYTGSEYRVEFEKDPETGAIYRAVINENG